MKRAFRSTESPGQPNRHNPFLSLWNDFQKVSADVGIATAVVGFIYLVVALIAIGHEIESWHDSV